MCGGLGSFVIIANLWGLHLQVSCLDCDWECDPSKLILNLSSCSTFLFELELEQCCNDCVLNLENML